MSLTTIMKNSPFTYLFIALKNTGQFFCDQLVKNKSYINVYIIYSMVKKTGPLATDS